MTGGATVPPLIRAPRPKGPPHRTVGSWRLRLRRRPLTRSPYRTSRKGAQYQNIARVVVTDVVLVDDDNIIAALKGSLPALERAAAACDAETEHGFATGAVYSPLSSGDQVPDEPSDDDGV